MFFSRKPAKPSENPGAAAPVENRRRFPRYETVIVSCSLGDLKDLSRTGARVQCGGTSPLDIGQTMEIELRSPTEALLVKGKVVRVTPAGRGRCDVGLEFVEVAPHTAEAIENLAKHGSTKGTRVGGFTGENARKLVAALRMPDHYASLGLSPAASDEDIHKAFKALARKCHPDINREPEAVRTFCAINDAHRVLGDPERRREYDLLMGLKTAA